jgi:hypothetical protein
MEAILIEAHYEADVKFWLTLAGKTGTRARSLKTSSIEDKILAEFIEKDMKTRNVSRNSVMKILDK